MSNDAGYPLNNIKLKGYSVTNDQDFSLNEKESLLSKGFSTYKIDFTNSVITDRIITTYNTNSFDIKDNSYFDINRPVQVMQFRRIQRNYLLITYANYKLAKNGTRQPIGQRLTTPKLITNSLIGLYSNYLKKGWVEDLDNYTKTIMVEIDQNDKSRVNIMDNPNFVDPLLIFASRLQFVNN